jgi:hypothetical protein
MRLLIIFLLCCSVAFAADYTNAYTVYQNGNISPSYGQLVESTEVGTTLTIATAGDWIPWISSAPGNGTGSSNSTTTQHRRVTLQALQSAQQGQGLIV